MNDALHDFYEKIIDAYYDHPESDFLNEGDTVNVVVEEVTATIEIFTLPTDVTFKTIIFYMGEKILTVVKGAGTGLEFKVHNEVALTAAVLSI